MLKSERIKNVVLVRVAGQERQDERKFPPALPSPDGIAAW